MPFGIKCILQSPEDCARRAPTKLITKTERGYECWYGEPDIFDDINEAHKRCQQYTILFGNTRITYSVAEIDKGQPNSFYYKEPVA